MTMHTIKKTGRIALGIAMLATPFIIANAQNVATSSLTGTVVPAACLNFPGNLFRGKNDNEVTQLQQYLNAHNYLQVSATGYFGPLTFRAVQSFQTANNIPSTGFVGALTRAALERLTCSTTTVPGGGTGTSTSATTPNIYGLNPTSGPVGTTVTIEGSGFSTDGNIIHFGGGAIGNVVAQPAIFACPMMPVGSTGGCGNFSQTLTFTIPSSIGPYCAPGTACPMYEMLVTPDTYNVYVVDGNGTSNTEQFTVTGSSTLPLY